MTLTHQDEEWIENGLETLYSASLKSIPVNHAQVREYIDVQEFGLALDLLAHIQLKSGKPVSSDTIRIFEALATRMGMKPGDEWRGVAKIRAAR